CLATRYRSSFPTRRSSDLRLQLKTSRAEQMPGVKQSSFFRIEKCSVGWHKAGISQSGVPYFSNRVPRKTPAVICCNIEGKVGDRSEEHTSELQSRENLVCR